MHGTGEVNADVRKYVQLSGDRMQLSSVDTTDVGRKMLTKALGSWDDEDLVDRYPQFEVYAYLEIDCCNQCLDVLLSQAFSRSNTAMVFLMFRTGTKPRRGLCWNVHRCFERSLKLRLLCNNVASLH